MILLLAVFVALAGDDEPAPAVTAVAAAPVAVPDGPPVAVSAEAGDDLQALVRELPAGSHLRLGPGTHRGPLVLDRSIELSGEPGAVLDGGGRGTVLVVAAPDVSVHDLRITGGGYEPQHDDAGVVVGADRFRLERVEVDHTYLGIDVRMASDGVVTHCKVTGPGEGSYGLRGDGIRLWEANRNEVTDNELDGVRDLVVWYSDDNRFVGNRVTRSRYGTHFMHTAGNVVEGSVYEGDVVGVFVMYSDHVRLDGNTVSDANGQAGMGFGFKDSDEVVVTNNRLLGNTVGLYLDTTPQRVGGHAEIGDNLVGANDIGVRFHGPESGAVFHANLFRSNRAAVAVDGGADATGSTWDGNGWSDYAGYDLDDDGRGDLPFDLVSLSGQLRDRRPDLAFFDGTPAASLLDLFASAFPMFAPKPILRDAAPLMEAR